MYHLAYPAGLVVTLFAPFVMLPLSHELMYHPGPTRAMLSHSYMSGWLSALESSK